MSEPTFGSGIAMGFKLGATIKTVATAEAQKLLKAISGSDSKLRHDLSKEDWAHLPAVNVNHKDLKSK